MTAIDELAEKFAAGLGVSMEVIKKSVKSATMSFQDWTHVGYFSGISYSHITDGMTPHEKYVWELKMNEWDNQERNQERARKRRLIRTRRTARKRKQ